MSDFLREMAALSAERAAQVKAFRDDDFDKPVVPLSLSAFDVIAEIKNRSPAEGLLLKSDVRPSAAERATAYAAGGAAAISVLTEPSRFDGDLSHLEHVAATAPNTPVMRKDFLCDVVQVLEARRAGASGVLLIAAMLKDSDLQSMLDAAFEHKLFVLLEAFDETDLRRASQYAQRDDGVLLVGVNTRNLRTLEVDAQRLQTLAPLLPDCRCVAESGLHTPDDAATAAALGYSMALVGTALMRSDTPAELIRQMRAAGAATCS